MIDTQEATVAVCLSHTTSTLQSEITSSSKWCPQNTLNAMQLQRMLTAKLVKFYVGRKVFNTKHVFEWRGVASGSVWSTVTELKMHASFQRTPVPQKALQGTVLLRISLSVWYCTSYSAFCWRDSRSWLLNSNSAGLAFFFSFRQLA